MQFPSIIPCDVVISYNKKIIYSFKVDKIIFLCVTITFAILLNTLYNAQNNNTSLKSSILE